MAMNRREFTTFTGEDNMDTEQMMRLTRFGPRIVIVTNGRHGAIAVERDGAMVELPAAFEVEPEVDATTAGDCLLAGFIDGCARRMSLRDALYHGTVLGALKTQRMGGTNVVPAAVIGQFYQSQQASQLSLMAS